MQWLITILAALLTASRIVRLRFSVIAASRFDQKPCGFPTFIIDGK